LDERFPKGIPYVYQIAALAGFGNLMVSKDFLIVFGEYMRFWYCFLYLVVALGNTVAINLYLGIVKKLLNYASFHVHGDTSSPFLGRLISVQLC